MATKLIQMPLSIGGHFQFKHEKSWDVSTGPSLYDKYFDIDMNTLANALCTIPFYDRNVIDKETFSESEILTMDNRATRYKQKYYNDKSYTTPDLKAQENTLKLFEEALRKPEHGEHDSTREKDFLTDSLQSVTGSSKEETSVTITETESLPKNVMTDISSNTNIIEKDNEQINDQLSIVKPDLNVDDVDDLLKDVDAILINKKSKDEKVESVTVTGAEAPVVLPLMPEPNVSKTKEPPVANNIEPPVSQNTEAPVSKNTEAPVSKKTEAPMAKVTEPTRNPVIESPEDLEKWLDDFLDG